MFLVVGVMGIKTPQNSKEIFFLSYEDGFNGLEIMCLNPLCQKTRVQKKTFEYHAFSLVLIGLSNFQLECHLLTTMSFSKFKHFYYIS